MGQIKDFTCNYSNSAGVYEEVTKGLDVKFPDAYMYCDSMVKLSMALRDFDDDAFCKLPFSHTIEADALGANIKMGDERTLPMPGEKICKKTEEILELPDIDYDKGRICQVLKACKTLSDQGEHVVLDVCGPFTVMSNLIEYVKVFKTFRKDPDTVVKAWWKLGEEALKYMKKAKECGVEFLSYEDPMAGVNIIGEPMLEMMVKNFTYDFMKKVKELSDEKTMIVLCPKTTLALIGTGCAHFSDVEVKSPIRYGQACVELLGKVKVSGMTCIKNINYEITNGIFREVVID